MFRSHPSVPELDLFSIDLEQDLNAAHKLLSYAQKEKPNKPLWSDQSEKENTSKSLVSQIYEFLMKREAELSLACSSLDAYQALLKKIISLEEKLNMDLGEVPEKISCIEKLCESKQDEDYQLHHYLIQQDRLIRDISNYHTDKAKGIKMEPYRIEAYEKRKPENLKCINQKISDLIKATPKARLEQLKDEHEKIKSPYTGKIGLLRYEFYVMATEDESLKTSLKKFIETGSLVLSKKAAYQLKKSHMFFDSKEKVEPEKKEIAPARILRPLTTFNK